MGCNENRVLSIFRKIISLCVCLALAVTFVPAAALVKPQKAEAAPAASSAPSLTITRANTGKLAMKKGSSYKLGAKASAGAKITYKSSKSKTVSVSKKGVLKAKGTGKATITVTAKKSGKSAKTKISVAVINAKKYAKVKKLKADASPKGLLVGKSTKVKVSLNPASASNKNVTFKSSNSKILAVDAKGKVMAKKAGKAKVTVISCENSKKRAAVVFIVKTANEPGADGGDNDPGVGDNGNSDGGDDSGNLGDGDGKSDGSGSQNDGDNDAPNEVEEVDLELDSDGDGYSDYVEKNYMGTDPNKVDLEDALDNKTVYDEDAKVMSAATVQFVRSDENNTSVTLPAGDNYEVGDVVVVEPGDSCPGDASLKVDSVIENVDGTMTVSGSKPALAEAVSYLNVNESLNVDWDNIEVAEGVEMTEEAGSANLYGKSSARVKSLVKKRKLVFTFGNWGEKETYEDKKDGAKTEDSTLLSGKIEFDIEDVVANLQVAPVVKYMTIAGVKAPYKTDVELKKCSIKVNAGTSLGVQVKEKHSVDVKLAEIPIWGVIGEGIYLKLTLHAEADGTVLLEVGADCEFGCSNAMESKLKPTGKASNVYMKGELNVEVKSNLNLKLALELFGIDVLAAGTEVGLKEKAGVTNHTNPVMSCVDAGAWFFWDGYVEALGGLEELNARLTLEIFNEKNSPFKTGWHWEDGACVGGASECTWREDDVSTDGGSGGGDSSTDDEDSSSDVDWQVCGTCEWRIADNVLTIRPADGNESGVLKPEYSLGWGNIMWPWQFEHDEISSIELMGKISTTGDAEELFSVKGFGTTNIVENIVGLENLDTSNVTNMSHMFRPCSSLASLDLTGFDTSSATNMSGMFAVCSSLTSLDLSSFDTSNVTKTDDMFADCLSLQRVRLGDHFSLQEELPVPASNGVEGKWKNAETGVVYDSPEDIPSNVAATYVAVFDA